MVLDRLGHALVRRRRWVLGVALAVTVLAGVLAAGTLDALVLSRWQSPGSESMRAAALLQERFGTASPNLMVVVTAKQGDVDSPEVAAAGTALTRELLARPEVDEARSYWTSDADPLLRSANGRQALIVGLVPGDATAARGVLAELAPDFTRDDDTISVQVSGREEVSRQISAQAAQDFVRAEAIIFPLVLLLLVWVFRGFGPALATLGVGLFAMVSTMAGLRVVASFTEVSTFALNITLAMGLGLGIDYCLIVVSRFREQRQLGQSRSDAVVRTVATAGRTVLFSGLTVAISLLGLLLLPFPFLRAFAYAGILVVAFSMLGAIVVLPALLAATRKLGDRVPRASRGFWHRGALAVMRRPVLYGGTAAVVLALLGAPFLGLTFGLPDERTLPPGAQVRTVEEQINAGFPSEPDDALQAVIPHAGGNLERYAADLRDVNGVARVDLAGQQGESAWLAIVPTSERLRADPLGLVADIRAVDAPFTVHVGGYPAELADYRQALLDRLPWVLVTIFACTFVILFLMTGSVLLPVKATVMNVLSLSAMFGVLVWGFQDGNLAGLLGFTPTGTLETSIPLLMFCIAYGLSMDYEVFMLSRIKEEYDRTGDNTAAVAHAMERSGPLITAAAAILALSFAVYATSGVVFLKMLGVGLAVAILVDATLIRALLVPAFMRLAGRANWWAPQPLRRLHARFGLREGTASAST
jgi:RND superfamily putative drug exporter